MLMLTGTHVNSKSLLLSALMCLCICVRVGGRIDSSVACMNNLPMGACTELALQVPVHLSCEASLGSRGPSRIFNKETRPLHMSAF